MSVSKKNCRDCGPTTVHHRAEWFSVVLDFALSPVLGVFEFVSRKTGGFLYRLPFARCALPLARAGVAFRLGALTKKPDEKDNLRTQAMWESAEKRGISITQFRIFGNPNSSFFVARRGGRIRVFDGLPRIERMPSASLRWMDNKAVMKKKFLAADIPVAKGGACFSLPRAIKIFQSIEKPVIVKPHIGSRSRHTSVHIEDEHSLTSAFRAAKKLSPFAVVEEELVGEVHRASVIGGKLVGVIRREPAHVVCDGVSTVRLLVEQENKNPLRHGPIFHALEAEGDADAELRRQGLSWESVPALGTRVFLNQKVSRSHGGTTSDMTAATHPENIKLFEKVAHVLGDSLVGIDFIIGDISRPWTEQERCGVIECNSLPFLELHHYPFRGKSRDATGVLWDAVFPTSRRDHTP